MFLRGLSLDGQLRTTRSLLAQLRSARSRGLARAIVPHEDAAWAALVPDMTVYVARELKQVVDAIFGTDQLTLASAAAVRGEARKLATSHEDLRDPYVTTRRLQPRETP